MIHQARLLTAMLFCLFAFAPSLSAQDLDARDKAVWEHVKSSYQNGEVINVYGVKADKKIESLDNTINYDGEEWAITDNLEYIAKQFQTVIVKIYFADCPICISMAGFYRTAAREYAGKVAFLAAEVHYTPVNEPLLDHLAKTEALPTFVVYQSGSVHGHLGFGADFELPDTQEKFNRVIDDFIDSSD